MISLAIDLGASSGRAVAGRARGMARRLPALRRHAGVGLTSINVLRYGETAWRLIRLQAIQEMRYSSRAVPPRIMVAISMTSDASIMLSATRPSSTWASACLPSLALV